MKPEPGERIVLSASEEDVRRESARHTRRAFLTGGIASAAAVTAAYMAAHSRDMGRLQAALRHTENFNADVSRAVFNFRGLAPTYAVSRAVPLRLNGVVGLEQQLDLASWRLQLVGTRNPSASPRFSRDVGSYNYKYTGDMPDSSQAEDVKSAPGNGTRSKTGAPDSKEPDAQKSAPPQKPASDLDPTGAVDSPAAAALAAKFAAMAERMKTKPKQGDGEAGPSYSSLDFGTPGLLLTMDDLTRSLPQIDMVTQFKCVEGWSNITHWTGFRLRDLLAMYPPALVSDGRGGLREPRYVYVETPDGNYYGGYDLGAARHPQSLLVTGMGGAPLTQEHGAPLRLHMPIKYGYKQVKRIGLIAYTDRKPDDYWTKLGYDWYAGL